MFAIWAATSSTGCLTSAILQAVSPSEINHSYLYASNYSLRCRSSKSEKLYPIYAAIAVLYIDTSSFLPIIPGFSVCKILDMPFSSFDSISFWIRFA